jgi:hypothetical protein
MCWPRLGYYDRGKPNSGTLHVLFGSRGDLAGRSEASRLCTQKQTSQVLAQLVRSGPTGDIARPQTETLKAKKRTMPSKMLLLALNDHDEAVQLSKLDRCGKPGVELCNKCSEVANVRFGSLGKNFLTFLRWCGHLSGLLVRDARTRQKLACCRYQSLVLYLLVQRG